MTFDPSKVPLLNVFEQEAKYTEFINRAGDLVLDLSDWIPEFKGLVEPLMPGEMCVMMADCGVGKTAALQNLAVTTPHLNTALFELELPASLCFERFMAIGNGLEQVEVRAKYNKGDPLNRSPIQHIYVCDQANLSVPQIGEILSYNAIELNRHYQVVMIDYIGLIRSHQGRSRYERVSAIAEDCKVLAKEHDVVLLITTQIHRIGRDYDPTINLHDAKDSGSIENSAGLLLGFWRDPADRTKFWIRILKNTKGEAGKDICCKFDGAKMKIWQEQPTIMSQPDLAPWEAK